MKAFLCVLFVAATMAAPEPGTRDKRGLLPVSPYGLGLGYGGLYGGYGYGLGYGYGGLGYGYGGLGHHLPVLAAPAVVAVSKKVVEDPHTNKVVAEKRVVAVPELHAVHAVPALPVLPGLHGLPLHGLPLHGVHALPVAHALL